jgi:hypothetical protein
MTERHNQKPINLEALKNAVVAEQHSQKPINLEALKNAVIASLKGEPL